MSPPDFPPPGPHGLTGWKIGVIAALVLGIVGMVALRDHDHGITARSRGVHLGHVPAAVDPASAAEHESASKSKTLPRLLDLGAGKCMACKMMAPILDELREEYRGRLDVEVIDVWKDPAAGDKFGIRIIPTQIFFGPDGRERWRHTGFISKSDILAKWKEFGIDLRPAVP